MSVIETSGFDAAEASSLRADLYIASMGRAGSTAFANLLTTPPKRWVWVEPWFVNGGLSRDVRSRAAEFGLPGDDFNWWIPPQERNFDGYLRRYNEFLAPHLSGLDRWGVKEVRGAFHEATIRGIKPKKIVILVRNMRDVTLSLLEKNKRQSSGDRGKEWIVGYCTEAAESLVSLVRQKQSTPTMVIRFEEFYVSNINRKEVQEFLDWPMDGDPHHGLRGVGRGYEVERQQSALPRLLPDDAEESVERVMSYMEQYNEIFGY